ncbi:MAG: hypothetical protein ILNGONEN_01624 [Syntrophorhabdaceae bacterium]|nr:hypothetical protein [Syntrophorhabdaceae bacterium]
MPRMEKLMTGPVLGVPAAPAEQAARREQMGVGRITLPDRRARLALGTDHQKLVHHRFDGLVRICEGGFATHKIILSRLTSASRALPLCDIHCRNHIRLRLAQFEKRSGAAASRASQVSCREIN